MSGRMTGRAVLVTGGGGGIGAATARLFAEEGARVAIVDHDATAVVKAASEIAGAVYGATMFPLVGDLASESEARRVVDAAAAAMGKLDGLVNVAGVRVYVPLAEATPEDWQHILGVNVLAKPPTAARPRSRSCARRAPPPSSTCRRSTA